MGTYYHSAVKATLTPEMVEADMAAIVGELWPDHPAKYDIVRATSAPGDTEAFWAFWLRDWEVDAAFSIRLLKDGRLEFKVPRSQWDEWYEDQQKIRRRLVRRYNEVADA